MAQIIEPDQREALPLFVARFEEEVKFVFRDQESETAVANGEVLVAGETDQDGQIILQEIRRISIASQPLEELGVVSFSGPAGPVQIEPGPSGNIQDFNMWLYYKDLGVSGCADFDATYADLKRTSAEIVWEPEQPIEDKPVMQLSLFLTIVDEGLLIQAIEIEPVTLTYTRLVPGDRDVIFQAHKSISPCGVPVPGGSTYDLRRLGLRFTLLTRDPSLTLADAEDIANELVSGACEVWLAKGGIAPDPHPDVQQPPLPTTGYECSDDPNLFCVLGSTEEDSLQGIVATADSYMDVFLVDRLNADMGGGVAKYCTAPIAFIILEIERARHNRFLLAHELGHVLGLRHPGESDLCPVDHPTEEGSYCAVMVPGKPNSNRITGDDLTHVDAINPPLGPNMYGVLMSLATDRNVDLEAGFHHIVRDFPYDDGEQPSIPGPVAERWWTHSDVWNSDREPHSIYDDPNAIPYLYDGGDPADEDDYIINPDHSPRHGEPFYSGPNNYMYARVHACEPLADGVNMKVYLLLAQPGVPGEPLTLLGQYSGADCDSTYESMQPLSFSGTFHPTPGRPKVRYVQWDVPCGYASDCCVFAVVCSDVDPPPPNPGDPPNEIVDIVENPGNYGFYELFSRIQTDNDVAQRNLHIEGVMRTSGAAMLPLMAFANILKEPAVSAVEIDTRRASGIGATTILINDEPVTTINGAARERVRLRADMEPGERLDFRLQADLSGQNSLGATFPISLSFFLNDQLVNGFEHVIKVTTDREVAVQTLDTVFGALRDVAAAWELDAASELAMDVRNIVLRERELGERRGCVWVILDWLTGKQWNWESEFLKLDGRFQELSQLMRRTQAPEPEYVTVVQKLTELAELLDAKEANYIVQIRDLAYQIQYAAGYVVRNKERQ